MSIPDRPVIFHLGKRPPPLVPPDVEEIVRVLNGEPPKVCPACGRSWRPDAPCVCLEPVPVVSWWARLWHALSAPWAAPEPVVIYEDEVPRPQPMPRPRRGQDFSELPRPKPPTITSGRMQHALAANQSVPGRIVVTVKDP